MITVNCIICIQTSKSNHELVLLTIEFVHYIRRSNQSNSNAYIIFQASICWWDLLENVCMA